MARETQKGAEAEPASARAARGAPKSKAATVKVPATTKTKATTRATAAKAGAAKTNATKASATKGSTPKAASKASATTASRAKARPSTHKTAKTPVATKARRSPKAKTATPKKAARAAKPKAPAYLAVELGTPVDPQGEPIGAGSPRAQDDRELQEYALQLWRQMQRGSVTKRYMRSMERAGLTLDEVWTVGLREVWTTSSTADEMRRYRQKMLFRANLLEAILSETVADLRRLEGIEPRDGADTAAGDPAPALPSPDPQA